jgi:heat shock protein 5
MTKGPVIGIDVGTTYSYIGVFKNGKVEIHPNEQGKRITPSYVAFTDNKKRLVGDAAKNQATINTQSTIFVVRRLMRRRFSEASVQGDTKTRSIHHRW